MQDLWEIGGIAVTMGDILLKLLATTATLCNLVTIILVASFTVGLGLALGRRVVLWLWPEKLANVYVNFDEGKEVAERTGSKVTLI